MTLSSRTQTPVDAVADAYLDAAAAHDPFLATYVGVPGHETELPGYDPDWYAERAALRRRTARELAAADPQDANDRITVAALGEELEVAARLREIDADEAPLNNIDSPVQYLRDVFDLMPTATVDDWARIATRLAAVPGSVAGYLAALQAAVDRGRRLPRRQVRVAMEQARANAAPDGFFATFARTARPADGGELPGTLRRDLEHNAARAAAGYERMRAVLGEQLLPGATDRDAVGREAYLPRSRQFVGARIDVEETYDWGRQELDRISRAMQDTAARIRPGASVAEAVAALDADPARRIEGSAALQEWMQRTSDEAVEALAGSHFDIPDRIRRLECRIAPTSSGGIYYTPPSDDLVTRPGRMWWAVPEGVTSFSTWQERTTVYHEGVPGHHLQCAQTVYRRDVLGRWRRIGIWNSGYGEGWALYAEQLMAELGFLDDPGDYLGMLDAQSLRAARVVLDIGVHCQLPAPPEVGGGAWDYDKAWRFLAAHCTAAEGFRRFELDRYLGWPGQAPSYAIGRRLWEQLRDEVRAREGAAFELARFHRRALDVGAVQLDVLARALRGEFD